MYSVDELIETIAVESRRYYDWAYAATNDARAFAGGSPVSVNPEYVQYIQKPTITPLDTGLGSGVAATSIVAGLRDDLERYFNAFFPDVNARYAQWITQLKTAVETGVPLTLDNQLLNAQNQALDTAEGVRTKRKIRAEFSGRGYQLPPGAMVAAVLDESDMRTEKLITGAIGSANRAVDEVISSYKTVISASIATSDARVAAINAMSELIQVSASMYTAQSESTVALYRARSAAAEAAIALYNAELKVDEINASLYNKNVQIGLQNYEKVVQMYLRNEKFQVEAAVAGAHTAGKVAQAAFSALNTIVGSSTAGFA